MVYHLFYTATISERIIKEFYFSTSSERIIKEQEKKIYEKMGETNISYKVQMYKGEKWGSKLDEKDKAKYFLSRLFIFGK